MIIKLRTLLLAALVLLALPLALPIASACQVPVFRYALERWEADTFRLQLVHRAPLPPAMQELLLSTQEELSRKPPIANLELEVLDVTRLSETQQLSVVGLDQVTEWPAFLLHPPQSWGNAPPLILPAKEQTLQQILHSPARQRCIDDLVAGESAVWFLIESGDPQADQDASDLLTRSLQRAQEEIEIPEGVLRPEELDTAGGNVDLDDVLRSSIPLRISFKIERIRRDDPAEQIFLQLLTGPSRLALDGPVIVPVFGRGRTPGPVLATSVTEERILQACAYLCGACSCQVKSGNPGYDLLFQAPWHDYLQDGLIVIDKALPPLLGVGALTQATTTPIAESEPTTPTPRSGLPLWRMLGAALLVILIGGSLALSRRARP